MIGRKQEKEYLLNLLKEEESQFIAVFGRRRIGKTYLIRESFEHKFTFQHTGLSNISIPAKQRKQAQLNKFAESLKESGLKEIRKLTSWNDAFNALKEVIKKSKDKKKVIFIDELSWMDTKNSDLISALESFWNGWATARKEKDIILIVCSSATYWITDKIVNSRGGLHNRLTGQLHLKPFTLKECEEYLLSKNIIFNRHQILQCYMIMGGVPYYWSLLKKGKSLPQNIDELFFAEDAPLKNEYNNLYSALFNKPDQYIKIIETLCSTNKGLTRDELCKKSGIDSSGNLTKKLIELESCGFIRKYIPYGYQEKTAIYQLLDNYTCFYHKFLNGKTSDGNFWKNNINTPGINSWTGIAFEKVCLEHIPQIKLALGISGVNVEVNAWKCKKNSDIGIFGSQIDLLLARKDQIIDICEIKYSETEYPIDATFDQSMRHKISDFKNLTKTKSAIHPILITTYGIIENSYSGNLQKVITCEELFKI